MSGFVSKLRAILTPPKRLLTQNSELIEFVSKQIGTKPKEIRHYEQAVTHASYPYMDKGGSNERLEFLGDSVLSQIISDAVYHLYPEEDEGGLSQLRSYLVSRNNMNRAASNIGLSKVLRTGPGINLQESDILGNALEALVGAIYLDHGMKVAVSFVRRHIIKSQKYVESVSTKEEDYKTEFIILMQKHKVDYDFEYLGATMTAPNRIIHHCRLAIGPDRETIATGEGTSKKNAHQDAAQKALKWIRANEQNLTLWVPDQK